MLTITQRQAARLRSVCRQALNLTSRSSPPPVYLEGGPHGLRIRCFRTSAAAVEYQLDAVQPVEAFAVPFELLADVEGRKDEPVELQLQDGRVLAEWHDGSVPQLVVHDVPDSAQQDGPPRPESFAENPPRLLPALVDACQTTDPESSRYALGCVQLRGGSGKIAAADGRQLVIHSGLTFPWQDDLLLPASNVFGSAHLPGDQTVFVGRTEKWFTFRVGPWTIWLHRHQDGRFPSTEDIVRRREEATASVRISPSDRTFLRQNLPRLPSGNGAYDPVTVELNGRLAIRARGQQGNVTELILSDSPCTGDPVRLNMDRHYLARAATMGFEQLYAFDAHSPVQCQDEHRQYAWALLDPKAAIAPAADAVRIESSVPDSSTFTSSQPRKTRATMSKTRNESTRDPKAANDRKPSSAQATVEPENPIGAIEQATALRATLREAAAQASELIRTLKRDKKQSRLLRSTLDSLRQLQEATR